MPKRISFVLAWSHPQQTYILSQSSSTILLDIEVETAAWFTWLDQVSSFAFIGQRGSATLRKESIHGKSYWYAYQRTSKKLIKKYIGKTNAITIVRLEQVVGMLESRETYKVSLHHAAPVLSLTDKEHGPGVIQHPQPSTSHPSARSVLLDPLLATKLQMPRPRAHLVLRPHLLERLKQVWISPLTLVSAPAGFGKTTLLAQWRVESSRPVAWLSLDPRDNDPVRFLSYLLAALQVINVHCGADALELLHAPQPVSPETVVALLTNDLIRIIEEDFALVLDDYHVITATSIQHAMNFLLEHLPPQMHLVLVTRADPPLPLSRLRAHNHLLEVKASDLRFSSEEVDVFLRTVMGVNLPLTAIDAIESRTEGWVAGLQLVALSLQGRADVAPFLATFSGSHRFVLDYLSEEVLSRQSASVQAFLQQTSILERLCGPLCDVVTRRGGSQATLEVLERANLFVVPLDDERGWYRYHHLFAEALRRHLHQSRPDVIPELHRLASEWYEQHGHIIEAVQHALTASDFERAVRLIEDCVDSMFIQGQLSTLLGWLEALPASLMHTRPLLIAQQAAALLITGQQEAALQRIQEAERGIQAALPAEQVQLVQAWLALLRASFAYLRVDLRQTVLHAQEALRLFPASKEDLRAGARSYANYSYLVSGDMTPGIERQIAAAVHSPGNLFTRLRTTANLARLQTLQGNLRQAALTYTQAASMLPEHRSLRAFAGSPTYSFGLADVLREWNQLDEAARHVMEGMELVREAWVMDAHVILLGYVTQARLKQAYGALDDAVGVLEEFEEVAQKRHYDPQFIAQGTAVRMRMELARGNLTRAIHWANEHAWPLKDEPLSYPCEQEYLTLARVRIAQRRNEPENFLLSETVRMLNRLLKDAKAKARMSSVIEILLLRALAFAAQDERTHALASLEHALRLAEPEGYIRLFIDEGEAMAALLCHTHGVATDYVATLLAAFDTPEDAIPALSKQSSDLLVEPLTVRELDVLRLLVAGLSNGAIAQELVITVGTVKRHINSIYGKLGVKSRTQAIVRVHTLSLL